MSIKRRQRGLTMVELIIFIIIVGVAVVGVLQVITLNTRNSADPARRKQALAIAEGLMEEVRLAPFTACDGADPAVETPGAACTVAEGVGPEPGNSRPYDNVNDYVGAFGVPMTYATDMSGVSFVPGYAATVTIVEDGAFGPAVARLPQNVALRITVSVAYGSDSVVLESYRTRYTPQNLPISPPPPL
jgi:MSHA pilin protein MshD